MLPHTLCTPEDLKSVLICQMRVRPDLAMAKDSLTLQSQCASKTAVLATPRFPPAAQHQHEGRQVETMWGSSKISLISLVTR